MVYVTKWKNNKGESTFFHKKFYSSNGDYYNYISSGYINTKMLFIAEDVYLIIDDEEVEEFFSTRL